jgi:hypothetical protein
MLKQQTVSTTMGPLTVSTLSVGDLRKLDSLFRETSAEPPSHIAQLLKYMPVIFGSVRKVHQDMSLEQLEDGLTLEDLVALFTATLDVSGLKRAEAGEPIPVPV